MEPEAPRIRQSTAWCWGPTPPALAIDHKLYPSAVALAASWPAQCVGGRSWALFRWLAPARLAPCLCPVVLVPVHTGNAIVVPRIDPDPLGPVAPVSPVTPEAPCTPCAPLAPSIPDAPEAPSIPASPVAP